MKTPRFLFRGFHAGSGGHQHAAELNNVTGVTPPAFYFAQSDPYNPMPTSLRHISTSELYWFVQMHITHQIYPTPFSSWTGNFDTAVRFATRSHFGSGDEYATPGFVAILDTQKLHLEPGEGVGMRVIYLPTLGHDIPVEYLVYGPVFGPGYHALSVTEVRKTLDCSHWPYCPTRSPRPHLIAFQEIQEAMQLWHLFPETASLEMLPTIAAAELSRQQSPSKHPREFTGQYTQLTLENQMTWTEDNYVRLLCSLSCLSTKHFRQRGLVSLPFVNLNVESNGLPQQQLMEDLMAGLQDYDRLQLVSEAEGGCDIYEDDKKKMMGSAEWILTQQRAFAHDCEQVYANNN